MPTDVAQPRFLEFFSGIGLVRLALEAEGARCVFANDIDPEKCAIYRRNFGAAHLDGRSVTELGAGDVPDAELATASFPCTDLTMCGRRQGFGGTQSSLVWEFVRIIGELHEAGRAPRALLLENVLGMLGPSMIDGTARLVRMLDGLGYDIDVVLADARWFTPQSRRRVFVIAVDRRTAPRSIGAERAFAHRCRGRLVQRLFALAPDASWNFRELPDPCATDEPRHRLCDIVADPPDSDPRWLGTQRLGRILSRLARSPRDHAALLDRARHAAETTYLSAAESGSHTQGVGTRVCLREDAVNCLLQPRGGNARHLIVRVRDGEVRARPLNGLEYARLQGVALAPASPPFVLPKGENRCKRAFADAVCVPLVRWLYRHGLRPCLAEGGTGEARLSRALGQAHAARMRRNALARGTVETLRGGQRTRAS